MEEVHHGFIFIFERALMTYLMVSLFFAVGDTSMIFIIMRLILLFALGCTNCFYCFDFLEGLFDGRSVQDQRTVEKPGTRKVRRFRSDWCPAERYAFWIERLVMLQVTVCTYVLLKKTHAVDHRLLQLPSFIVFPASNLLYLLASNPNLLKLPNQESKEDKKGTDGSEETEAEGKLALSEEKCENLMKQNTELIRELTLAKAQSESKHEFDSEEEGHKSDFNIITKEEVRSLKEENMSLAHDLVDAERELEYYRSYPLAVERVNYESLINKSEEECTNLREENMKLVKDLVEAKDQLEYNISYPPICCECVNYANMLEQLEEELRNSNEGNTKLADDLGDAKLQIEYYTSYPLLCRECVNYENMSKKMEEELCILREENMKLAHNLVDAEGQLEYYFDNVCKNFEEKCSNLREENMKLTSELEVAKGQLEYYVSHPHNGEEFTNHANLFKKSEEECSNLRAENMKLIDDLAAANGQLEYYISYVGYYQYLESYMTYPRYCAACVSYWNMFTESKEEVSNLQEDNVRLNLELSATKTQCNEYYQLLMHTVDQNQHVKCREEMNQLIAELNAATALSREYSQLLHDLD